jgi:hypothetical protein
MVAVIALGAWRRPYSSAGSATNDVPIAAASLPIVEVTQDTPDASQEPATAAATAIPSPEPTPKEFVTSQPATAGVESPSPTATIEPDDARATPSAAATSTPSPTPSPVVSRVELVRNGGFEVRERGWSLDAGASAAALNAHNGHVALILASSGGTGRQSLTVAPGETYRFSAWCLVGAAGDRGWVTIEFLGVDGQPVAGEETVALEFVSTHYTRGTVMFTVPIDVSALEIAVHKPAGAGIVAFDDVSLRHVSYSGDPERSEDAD